VARATDSGRHARQLGAVGAVRVAILCTDMEERAAIARAFDAAPGAWAVELCDREPEPADVIVYGSTTGGVGAERRAVRFDPRDPPRVVADVRRALATTRASCIVVTGAGRGVGQTTVALHLAQALAADRSCLLLDLDVDWGCAPRLGIDAVRARTWADAHEASGGLRLSALPVAGGIRVMLAPRDGCIAEGASVLDAARAEFDQIVVDAPFGEALDAGVGRADAGVLVLNPTKTCAVRARELVGSLDVDAPWAVVSNRLGPGGEATRAELEELVGRPFALELPCCPALRDAEDSDRLLKPRLYRWTRAVARLAHALTS
jgi:hypothetical protein